MWFLGEPSSLIVSLNQANPGPVEVVFEDLERRYQHNIITGMQAGHISADVDINVLVDIYQPEPAQPRVKKPLLQPAKYEQEKLDFLTNQPATAVARKVATEKNLHLVKQIYLNEAKHKNRKTVLKACIIRLAKAGEEIIDAIGSTTPVTGMKELPGETMIENVIDSEDEEIVLTAEQIAQLQSLY